MPCVHGIRPHDAAMQSQPRRIRLESGEVIDAEDLPSAAVRAPPPLPAAKTLVTAPERIVAVECPQTDREVLDAVMSVPGKLTERERKAFGEMRSLLTAGRIRHLEWKQRTWAQKVAARLGFDVDDPGEW
jgi:hypothetical protein